MTSYIRTHKFGKLLSVMLAVSICLALVCGITHNAFAGGTASSDAVKTVFFYATDTNGQTVYVSSATMDELTNSEFCHGQADGKNYYNAMVDSMPAAVYAEGVGVTLDDFVTYMTGRSSVANADKLSFTKDNNGADRLVLTANDGGASTKQLDTVDSVFGKDRYYFPDLPTYLKTTDGDRCIPAEDLDKVLATKQQMPVYLATSSAFSRVVKIQDEIAANGGVLTGCLKDSLTSDDALRLMIPMTISDLGEDGSEVEIGAGNSKKWVYAVTLKYKNNSDSPITSAGSVAAPTCKMVLDGTTLKITFDCATAGAEIYHSLDVDGDTVYAGIAPQNKYDGNTIEIKNYDTKKPVNIHFRAVKAGYTDSGVQDVSTKDYTLPTVDEDPNFVYSLTADTENYKVGESFNLSAALTADDDAQVYDMEYQVKVPTAAFSVEDVQTADGWQCGQAIVDGSKVLTFISTNEENGVTLTKDTALKFADITLKPVAEGEAEITIGDKTITKADASVYANVSGDGMKLTVEPGEAVLGYQMKAVASKEQVAPGETFEVSVLVDSETVKTFGGAQALLSYDKNLVAMDSVKEIADDFSGNETADGYMIAGFGSGKDLGNSGYSLVTLTFKALDNIPAGKQTAVFGLSEAMVSANGETTGVIPDVVGAEVKIKAQADYQLIAQANPTEVKAGESFTVKVLVDSEKMQSFGGVQGLLTFDKTLVAYDGVASQSDKFDTLGAEATANGIFIAGAGQVKTIADGGFEVVTLNFHALSDLTAGTYDAVFDWSATQVVPNGQLVGSEPDTTSATVKITAEEQGQTTKVMKFDFNRNGEVDLLDVQFAYRLAWGAIQVNTDEEQKFLNYLFVEGYENNPGDAAFELTDFQKVYRQAWGADENYTIDMPNNLIKYYDVFSSRQ